MGDWRDIGPDNDDRRYLLQKQERHYQRIKDSSTLKIQFVLSVVSLIASFGAIQFLLSRGIDSAVWQVPFELANRCSPDAITHRGLSFVGLGWWNSVLGFVLIGLGLWLVAEMLLANHKLQNKPALRPGSEADFYLGDSSTWLDVNREHVRDAECFLNSVNSRLQYSAIFGFIGAYVLTNVYLNQAFVLLLLDYALLVVGAVFVSLYIWKTYRKYGEIPGLLRVDRAGVSVAFLIVVTVLWAVGAYQLIRLSLLLDYFFLC
jgi:hypothetical protein